MTNQRFTKDGDAELEADLAGLCGRIASAVTTTVGSNTLEALVLGGGYGRGEGGVLRTTSRDQPYNDLEFYVFLRGHRLLNERRYGSKLSELAERLSPQAGLHVEFKIDSLTSFRKSAISIFSYDLLTGHKIIVGDESCFDGCQHHREASAIPLSEASRLLFNRCTGLLLAKDILERAGKAQSTKSGEPRLSAAPNAVSDLDLEDGDFVGRNLAKAQLSLGDAVLVAFGQYDWSCLERARRLAELSVAEPLPWLESVRSYHATGVEFKLHPRRVSKSLTEFNQEWNQLGALALKVWLWVEARRLGRQFESARDYSFHRDAKYPGSSVARNYLLNVRSFGMKAALMPLSFRYPRERLFNALSLLLWKNDGANESESVRHLQKQLSTDASDWPGLLTAYKRLWAQYG